LRVYPISDFSPSGDVYTDANNPKYNMPIFYNWNNVTIHESRMIAIKGMPFSSMNVQANPFQGRVTAAKKMEAVNAYYDAVGLTLKVLERKQQAVYTMQGLADALLTDKQNQTTDGEQTVRARINLVDNVRSLLNSVVIDGGDGTKESTGDEFVINDLSLSGIKDAVAIQESRVSADTGIPVTVLFGQSANGLNATGESDWKNYYSTLTAIQSMLRPAIERIVAMLAGQIDIKGLADNWKIEFNPLPDTDEKADAEVAKLKADANKVEADSIATIYNLGFTDDAQIIEYMKSKNLFGYAEEVSKSEAASYANETS
jgi:phage-related protein (TIGR01555 family)